MPNSARWAGESRHVKEATCRSWTVATGLSLDLLKPGKLQFPLCLFHLFPLCLHYSQLAKHRVQAGVSVPAAFMMLPD